MVKKIWIHPPDEHHSTAFHIMDGDVAIPTMFWKTSEIPNFRALIKHPVDLMKGLYVWLWCLFFLK